MYIPSRVRPVFAALVMGSLLIVTPAWSQAPLAAGTPASPPTAATPPTTAAPAAPSTAPAPDAPPPRCDGSAYRQFDFWVGEWSVFAPGGKRAGGSSIRLILDGCVVLENWKGGGGVEGTSFNIYDRTDRLWHQSWVDASGSRLELAGGLRGQSMVLSGFTTGPGGAKTTERITWTPLDGGKVRQLWEQSKDGGATWTVAFDGTYVRKGGTGAGTGAGGGDKPGGR
jgi:hypothetical protein